MERAIAPIPKMIADIPMTTVQGQSLEHLALDLGLDRPMRTDGDALTCHRTSLQAR